MFIGVEILIRQHFCNYNQMFKSRRHQYFSDLLGNANQTSYRLSSIKHYASVLETALKITL